MDYSQYPQPALQSAQAQPMPQQTPQQGPQMGAQQPAGQQMDPQTVAQIRAMQQQGMSPEEIKSFLALNSTRTQTAEAQRQRALAKELRGDAQGQFKGVDTGKFYVGPTWVNLLASVAQQRRAGQEEGKAKTNDEKVQKAREDAAKAFVQDQEQPERLY